MLRKRSCDTYRARLTWAHMGYWGPLGTDGAPMDHPDEVLGSVGHRRHAISMCGPLRTDAIYCARIRCSALRALE